MMQTSAITLSVVERSRDEEMHSHMRRRAVERIDQMEAENELSWPDLKLLSKGRDEIAAQVLKREVQDASDWWREQLRLQGHSPETVERLVKVYSRSFWTELRNRIYGF